MAELLHSVQDVARVLGRFEMHIELVEGSCQFPYGLDAFNHLGFSAARSIRAYPGEDSRGPRLTTLEKLGKRQGHSWLLSAPDSSNRAAWHSLLKTDTPLVVEASSDLAWVDRCVGGLYRPIIYFTGSSALTDGPVKFCRRTLRNGDGLLLVTSPHMGSISLFGKGPLFERALAASSEKASGVWGYSDQQRRDILRGGFRLFRAALS